MTFLQCIADRTPGSPETCSAERPTKASPRPRPGRGGRRSTRRDTPRHRGSTGFPDSCRITFRQHNGADGIEKQSVPSQPESRTIDIARTRAAPRAPPSVFRGPRPAPGGSGSRHEAFREARTRKRSPPRHLGSPIHPTTPRPARWPASVSRWA